MTDSIFVYFVSLENFNRWKQEWKNVSPLCVHRVCRRVLCHFIPFPGADVYFRCKDLVREVSNNKDIPLLGDTDFIIYYA